MEDPLHIFISLIGYRFSNMQLLSNPWITLLCEKEYMLLHYVPSSSIGKENYLQVLPTEQSPISWCALKKKANRNMYPHISSLCGILSNK